MEIDGDHFRKQLLSILKNIANATFISFDLEMSGITTRPKHSASDRSNDVGKPSLQHMYEESRAAAETFQVLQFGITCVEEDHERDYYLARPYNFNVSPLLLAGAFEIERKFSFSSSACEFLYRNGFNFGKIFSSGIPYLSKEEENETRTRNNERIKRTATIPDVVIPLEETETLAFYRESRNTITTWINAKKPKTEFVNVGNPKGSLNGYQRRLIHQLVRTEFPKYRTFARNDGHFMQIELLDQKQEDEVGLRWIFEALSGGDLSDIEPAWFCSTSEEDKEQNLGAITKELKEVTETLKAKKHVIVGHNLFMDLAFLYATFVGKLPILVEHFKEDIHQLFPFVIDTKYLSTHNADSMNPRVNLKELVEPFRKIQMPLIILHEQHAGYGSSFGKSHEAGYDSWMTAELFTKLTGKLYSEHQFALKKKLNKEPISSATSESESGNAYSGDEDEPGGALIDTTPRTMQDTIPSAWNEWQLNPLVPVFLSKNPFSLLDTIDDSPDEEDKDAPKIKQWLPSTKSKFWDVYKNKLRVNATESGVCDLAA
ncbi:hypothetical protein B7494_g5940 [Chlorociboria aeruginascens]|nr:hypothetical protein B7494_g5940 [Chlorociboria aeruginascens]